MDLAQIGVKLQTNKGTKKKNPVGIAFFELCSPFMSLPTIVITYITGFESTKSYDEKRSRSLEDSENKEACLSKIYCFF